MKTAKKAKNHNSKFSKIKNFALKQFFRGFERFLAQKTKTFSFHAAVSSLSRKFPKKWEKTLNGYFSGCGHLSKVLLHTSNHPGGMFDLP